MQTKLEFCEEVKEEERTAPESAESMVFIKMEESEKPCSLPKISEEPYGESCQVFVKEDVEEKNVIETSTDVSFREKDPLSR